MYARPVAQKSRDAAQNADESAKALSQVTSQRTTGATGAGGGAGEVEGDAGTVIVTVDLKIQGIRQHTGSRVRRPLDEEKEAHPPPGCPPDPGCVMVTVDWTGPGGGMVSPPTGMVTVITFPAPGAV